MGEPYCELWFKARDDAAVQAMKALDYDVARAGVWVRLWERDAESDPMGSLGWDRLAPDEPKPHGEVVYLALADAPEGESCGTFAYEHSVDGKVTRAVAFAPDDDGVYQWQRVEGAAEPWERPFGAFVRGEPDPRFPESELCRAVFEGVLTPRA